MTLVASIDVGFEEGGSRLAQITKQLSASCGEGPSYARDSIAATTTDEDVFPVTLTDADWVVILADGDLSYRNATSGETVKGTIKANQPTVLCLATAITGFYLTNAGATAVNYAILFGAAA